jgi:hypothetical protein
MLAALVAVPMALLAVGSGPPAGASTVIPLLVSQGIAFGVLGHSCGGIQEVVYATGFDPATGYPVGGATLSTRCGGSGRGGGGHTTTYTGSVAMEWDWTGAVLSATSPWAGSGTPGASYTDPATGNTVYNQGSGAYLQWAPAFTAPPRVTGLSTSIGPAGGGTSVTISGTGFTSASAVQFGGVPAATFTVNSDTSVTALSPATTAGSVDVTVTGPGGTSGTEPGDQFTLVPRPVITSISPTSGPATGGTTVQIVGSGFTGEGVVGPVDTGVTSVTFGGIGAQFTVNSDSSITAVSPVAENPDTEPVAVVSAGGTSPSARGDVFTYTAVGCATSCVSVGDAAVLEGASGNRTLSFPVSLSSPAGTQVSVHYAVTALTAVGAKSPGSGADFQVKSGTVTFTPNATTGLTPLSRSVAVTVYPDTTVEPDATLALTLSNPTAGFTLGRAVGTGTVLNDNPVSGINLGIGDGGIVAARSGSQSVALPVTLSAPAPGPVSVQYTVVPGTAVQSATAAGGGDYGGKVSGTLTLAAGSTAKNLTIPVWPDAGLSGSRTFSVVLSNPSGTGVSLFRPTGTCTIFGPT